MNKTLSVSAIENGTVIDHIISDQTLRIMHMLNLLDKKLKVTVGFNLPSKRMAFKDLIKIENHELTEKEASEIMVFAPEATINIIRQFEVTQKIMAPLPTHISGIFICPNSKCITHGEPLASHFFIEEQGKKIKLICAYCEKSFDRKEVRVSA